MINIYCVSFDIFIEPIASTYKFNDIKEIDLPQNITEIAMMPIFDLSTVCLQYLQTQGFYKNCFCTLHK